MMNRVLVIGFWDTAEIAKKTHEQNGRVQWLMVNTKWLTVNWVSLGQDRWMAGLPCKTAMPPTGLAQIGIVNGEQGVLIVFS